MRSAQVTLQRGCGVSTLFEFFQNILCLFYNSFYSSKIQKVRLYYKCCFDRIVDVGDYVHDCYKINVLMTIIRFNVVINSILIIRKCYIQTKLDGVENDYERHAKGIKNFLL